MADEDDTEKSEDPTQKRLEDAHARGDVVKSHEVSTWFVLAGATLILSSFSGSMSSGLMPMLRGLLSGAHGIPVDGRGLVQTMQTLGFGTIAAVALPFALLMLAAAAGNLIQHRLVWSAEGLKPKFSKVFRSSQSDIPVMSCNSFNVIVGVSSTSFSTRSATWLA